MMLGIWFRAGVSAAETALLAQGWDQLLLRKAANGVGGAIATASLLLMSVVRSPLVAMLAFTGVTLGNSFNQSSVTPNYLEVAGPDSAYFGSWTNTLAWASAWASAYAAVLEMQAKGELDRYRGLPTNVWSSDHMSLVADLAFAEPVAVKAEAVTMTIS